MVKDMEEAEQAMQIEEEIWQSIVEDALDTISEWADFRESEITSKNVDSSHPFHYQLAAYREALDVIAGQQAMEEPREIIENLMAYCQAILSEIAGSNEHNETVKAFTDVQDFVYRRLVINQITLGVSWEQKIEILEERLKEEANLYRDEHYPDVVKHRAAELFDEILAELNDARSKGMSGAVLLDHISGHARTPDNVGEKTSKVSRRVQEAAAELADNFVQKIVYGIIS